MFAISANDAGIPLSSANLDDDDDENGEGDDDVDKEQEEMQRLEDDHFKKQYHLRASAAEYRDCLISTSLSEEYEFVAGHIIIMGKSLSNLYDLVKPLTDKAIAAIKKVSTAQGFDYVLDSTNGGGVLVANGKDLMADVKKELGF